jgi:hypothetical protein
MWRGLTHNEPANGDGFVQRRDEGQKESDSLYKVLDDPDSERVDE